jgi:hypothetical protein
MAGASPSSPSGRPDFLASGTVNANEVARSLEGDAVAFKAGTFIVSEGILTPTERAEWGLLEQIASEHTAYIFGNWIPTQPDGQNTHVEMTRAVLAVERRRNLFNKALGRAAATVARLPSSKSTTS